MRSIPTRFQCGDLVAAVDFQGERARLTIGQTDYELRQTRTANGARYEAVDDATTWFWNVGRGGALSWRGRQYPECRELTTSPADLHGVEWVVEDLNGGGIIDRSRATLVFGADGRLSGRASCNTYTAAYTASGDTVRVSDVVGTSRTCAPSLMAQEQRFYDALKNATRFQFRADGALVLHADDGRRILARRGGPA